MAHGAGAATWRASATRTPATKPVAAAVRKARLAIACRRCRRQLVFIGTSIDARASGALARDRPSQRLDELLELRRRPALEGLAVRLIGLDHGIAVVPVQPRLGVEPERATRLLGHRREDVGARVAAVGARVAEDDHGRPRMKIVLDELAELLPDPPVVGVAADVGDAR